MTPVPTPSVTPVFASDEEALAAAEESYKRYLAVSDQIFAEGGANPERLAEVATGTFLDASITGFEKVQANGWRSTGATKADSFELQQVATPGTVERLIIAYACTDVSAIDVVDSDGNSVVSSTRPDRTYFEVYFDLHDQELLVGGREVWGDGAC